MRIALISGWEDERVAGAGRPAAIAGRPVSRRQLDLALALGCERIVCVAPAPIPEVVRMQSRAEKAGARFHAISGPRQLAGMVKAGDEVFVIAPQVLADAQLVEQAIADRPGILVLPADRGVGAGYERMDADNAWAGIMLVPGALADRLADLPADGDPFSTLLRIAMQAGTRRIILAPSALDHGDIALLRDREALRRAERSWLERRFGASGWRRPATALVRRGTRLFASRLVAYERPTGALIAGGALFTAGSVIAAWFEHGATGFFLLALASAAWIAAATLRVLAGEYPRPTRWQNLGDLALDAAFVAIAVTATPRAPQAAAFAAVVAVLALRLARGHGAKASIAPAGDRVLVYIAAAAATAFGVLTPALQAFTVATLAFELLFRSKLRLTRA